MKIPNSKFVRGGKKKKKKERLPLRVNLVLDLAAAIDGVVFARSYG